MKALNKIRVTFFIAFVVIMIAGLLAYSMWGDKLPIKEIKNFVKSSDLAPWIFIFLYIALSVFLPTTPMMAVGGIVFGFWFGFLYTTIAGFVSSVFTFFLARILGRSFVGSLLEHKGSLILEKYDGKMRKHGITTVVVLRIMPIMPFNVLNLLMGISKVSFKNYVAGTVVGLIPSNILAVYFGSLVLTLAFREISLYLAVLLVVGLIVLAYFRLIIVWRYFGNKRS